MDVSPLGMSISVPAACRRARRDPFRGADAYARRRGRHGARAAADRMRPSELCELTTGELDTSGEVWLYRPVHHKTAHHGH